MSSSSDITLTEDQENGLGTIMSFLDDPDEQIMAVEGFAGTGKSTLIQHAILKLHNQFKVAFTAPTNKATKVLRQMAANSGVSVGEASTIYSLLGLRLSPKGEIKNLTKGVRGSRLAEYDIVVVDECSMVNRILMEHIRNELWAAKSKLIFMGDPLQLPPIGEGQSESFDSFKHKVTLNRIVRQAADNPIIALTADIRESIEKQEQTFNYETKVNKAGQGVYVLPEKKWEAWMRAGFAAKKYKADGDAFRAIAWRNVSVEYYNDRIRQALYGEEAENRFLVGERVLNAEPILDEFQEESLVPTDSEGVIRDIEVIDHPYHSYAGLGQFKVYHLAIYYQDVGLVDAFVIHDDSLRDYNRKLNSLSEEARKDRKVWPTFWAFKESFNDIRPSHAITAHRSQGSTYENVFVDVGDIRKNLDWVESMKCLYVACSRAGQNLMLRL